MQELMGYGIFLRHSFLQLRPQAGMWLSCISHELITEHLGFCGQLIWQILWLTWSTVVWPKWSVINVVLPYGTISGLIEHMESITMFTMCGQPVLHDSINRSPPKSNMSWMCIVAYFLLQLSVRHSTSMCSCMVPHSPHVYYMDLDVVRVHA